MKKITLFLLMLTAGFKANAQSTIFEDSFESYTNFAITGVGAWTLTDLDLTAAYTIGAAGAFTYANAGGVKSFQVWNPSAVVPATLATATAANDFTSRTGAKSMACFNVVPAGGVTQNDDWLISPQMTLGTANTLKFWAKASDAQYDKEKFNVWVSTTNTTAPASFTKISTGDFIETAGIAWVEYTYALPTTYDNLPVYIAIHCQSDDQYVFLVDDFKVTGTVACGAPSAGTSVVNATTLTAVLSWTAGGALNSEIKVQAAGAGTPATTNDSGVNLSANTYTTMPLTAETNYEFWVRDECTDGLVFSSWSGPYLFNTNAVPNCASLVSPVNAATAINGSVAIPLNWTAAATGATATSYDVYLDTTPAATALAGNVTTTTYNKTGALALTTYYWRVVAKNAAGAAVGCTSIYSFTTAPNAFSPYCGPVTFSNSLEPITSVSFAGIVKTFANTVVPVATAVHHKIFTDVATVAQGGTYPIELKGMTDGNFTNRFVVFIDWNQNGVLSDAGEVYFDVTALTIINSTGLDAITATGNIIVPAGATAGNTRMRIKKQFGATNAANPCLGSAYGEVHDYNVTVTAPSVATNTFDNAKFSSYPNPVKDIFTVSYNKNITNVSVINLLGQELINKSNNDVQAKIDMSALATGNYLVKLTSDNEVKTIKVVKE